MTPGARVAAAIAVLDAWAGDAEGLDRVLAGWGRANRFAGSKDRHAIADLVYDAVRRLRSALWLAGIEAPDPLALPAPGRAALIGSLRLDGTDPDALFDGAGYAPAPLTEAERQAASLAEAPRGVRLDLPDWLLAPDLLGDVPEAALDRLRRRAPLHLRANLLRTTPEGAREALAAEGVETVPGPLAPACLTVTGGARRVAGSRAFADGLVEVQDAASQAVAVLCDARPGERVLDLCAGGGGKTLALAAAMGGEGDLFAHDAAAGRLAMLGPRAARAGARVSLCEPGTPLPRDCDLVLVDAPCTGSGAWARNPDAKWRLTRSGLDRLGETQAGLLRTAAPLLRPGGRLVYATCSMMPAENDGIVERLLAESRGFDEAERRHWTPLDGGDGFFAAVLRRARPEG